MPHIYVGANGKIAVIDPGTGKTIKEITLNKAWLKNGNSFVNMIKKDGFIYAHTYGRLYCIDMNSGKTIWSNDLKGLGFDLATIISDDDNNVKQNMSAAQMNGINARRRSSD